MMSKRILILGGAGNTGCKIALLLALITDVELVLAGRNLDKAQAMADALNDDVGGARVTARQVDASDVDALLAAFSEVDAVVVASSTTAYAWQVAHVAMAAGIDYFDTQLSTREKIAMLRDVRRDIEEDGLLFITDCGFHPGVPAALVRYAARVFDTVEKANVSALLRLNWRDLSFAQATAVEMVEEFEHYQPTVYHNGFWKTYDLSKPPRVDFGEPFGQQMCVPMHLHELEELPRRLPSLRETGFFIAGFNPFVDYVIIPLSFAALGVAPGTKPRLARLFEWGLKKFARPPYGAILRMDASGALNDHSVTMTLTLAHDDAYWLTAAPVAACLLQYLDGALEPSGLHFQANIVEPARFLRDLSHLGVNVTEHCHDHAVAMA